MPSVSSGLYNSPTDFKSGVASISKESCSSRFGLEEIPVTFVPVFLFQLVSEAVARWSAF